MKPAARGHGGGSAAPANGSQIPLPRRKGAHKSDVLDNDDTESDVSKEEFVTRGKMSLLSGTSFCCTSGQKDDYSSDSKFTPKSPRKKQPITTVVAKKEIATPTSEPSTPKSPLVAAKRSFLARSKQRKNDRVVLTDYQVKDSQQSINGAPNSRKDDLNDRIHNQHGENRLRPPEDRKKVVPIPQQRSFLRDPASTKIDQPEVRKQKYTEVMRKLRKDAPHYAPSNITSLNVESNKLFKRNNKVIDSCSLNHGDRPNRSSLMDVCPSTDQAPIKPCDSSSTNREKKRIPCDVGEDKISNVIDIRDAQHSIKSVDILPTANQDVAICAKVGSGQEGEDFDCPCCEKDTKMDDDCHESKTNDENNEMKNRLQSEILSLKSDLEAERTRLEIKHGHVIRLEQELVVMEQLKQELMKEQDCRRKAEEKLQEMLKDTKMKELQMKATEKRTESKSTQKDAEMSCTSPSSSENSSSLLLGYESRVRRYQSYIAKLEKDNQMLINELKKFKDLSPHSQEQQGKELLIKLDKLEQDNRQQQLQYESCLDEVANKLVHTLLVQKRLEEECKVLHLRVEQLEQENENLKELNVDDRERIMVKGQDTQSKESAESKVQIDRPSHNRQSSFKTDAAIPQRPYNLSDKKLVKETPDSSQTVSSSSSARSPATSPISPCLKPLSASKIPSFGSPKPVQTCQNRKKTKTENSIIKTPKTGDLRPKDSSTSSSKLVPNPSAMLLPPSKSKLFSPTEGTKASASAKRKRPSRNASPIEKSIKESKQRLRSNQMSWEQNGTNLANLYKNSTSPTSPSVHFAPSSRATHQIWSFNCTLQETRTLESPRKVAESLANLEAKSEAKSSTSNGDSSSTDVTRKTRDEGYSTMSSDLQPDSTTDSTVSEQEEHSSTYLVTEKVLRCTSNESVTECLDGSMSSSSDSGFGPLHQVTMSKAEDENLSDDDDRAKDEDESCLFLNHATVKIRGPLEGVKPAIQNLVSQCEVLSEESLRDCLKTLSQTNVVSERLSTPTNDRSLKDLFVSKVEQRLMDSTSESGVKWRFDVDSKGSSGKTAVETAEKATLTEPEEVTWREKALAHFIDESIWSLYSSENEIEVKPYSLEPDQQCNRSLEDLVDTSPCIILSTEEDHKTADGTPFGSSNNLPHAHNVEQTDRQASNGLERVASDTVLYLKDAIQELETSMMRGLKSSKNLAFKNIPILRDDGSIPTPEEIHEGRWKPELIRSLESAMLQQNNLSWPSPSRSSSTSSLQSSTSCHLISDETDDVDITRTSRKGSQDPDLSSASDVEYENLEHKEFVERWLRKEIAQEVSTKAPVSTLEPVGELGEWNLPAFQRKTSLPCDFPDENKPLHTSRVRLMSYPSSSTPIKHQAEPPSNPLSPIHNVPMFICEITELEDVMQTVEEFQSSVESETKEFNGDFYKLCSVGSSLKSLDCMPSFKPSILPKNFRCYSQSPERSDPSDANMKSEIITKSSVTKQHSVPVDPSFKPTDLLKYHHRQSQNHPIPTIVHADSNDNPQIPSGEASRNKSMNSSTSQNDDGTNPSELLKPARPVSLILATAPRVPEHNANDCLSETMLVSDTKQNFNRQASCELPSISSCENLVPELSESVVPSSTNVPPSNQPELRDAEDTRPNSICLPKTPMRVRKFPQQNSPILLSPESSVWSKRQQWKRDRRMARQNRMKEGCGTSWIHLQDNPDLYDPKARASLLDSLRAPTSSSGSSSEDEDENVVKDNLSPQHKTPKEKKLCAKRRPSIVDRLGLFYRFGEREQEAISYFDFLDSIPSSSIDTLNRRMTMPHSELEPKLKDLKTYHRTNSLSTEDVGSSPELKSNMVDVAKSSPSIARRLRLPNLWNQPLSHNMSSSTLNSQDCEILDHISLSDSCAESYSSTPDSYEEAS